ncbi:MAG: DUF3795 domain-containing protein [Candidatus Helarchaeota archaeon]
MVNKKLLAPCGLYCGVCGIYYADKNNDDELKKKLAKAYWTKPEQIKCEGCLSENKFYFCETCEIRKCVFGKGLNGCHECNDFPCKKIKNYPYKLATEYMLKSTLKRKDLNDDAKWIEWEENNWRCNNCGTVNFRGARRCRQCKNEIKNPFDL